jgi:hypothetical protein
VIDKLFMYGCTFRNLDGGAYIRGGTNGFPSFVGCLFENITGTAAKCDSKGNYVAGCDFVNCGTALEAQYTATIHNCTVTGQSGSKGFVGNIAEVISCSIDGCSPAVEPNEQAIISDVESDGDLKTKARVWVGNSEFRNLKCRGGAYYGQTDLTKWVRADEVLIDQSAPTAPGNLKVEAVGPHNILTWTPSSDPETRIMQYIIERQGSEIGRTNFNHSANFYAPREVWGAQGRPPKGVYRDPTPAYVDSNKAATHSAADYNVVAVNFAQIRSDGEMATLRLWPHNLEPTRVYISATKSRATDSVRVPLGALKLKAGSGERSFAAVRYAPQSQSGLKHGVTPVSVHPDRPAQRSRFSLTRPTSPRSVSVYNLKGARVARIACAGLSRAAVRRRARALDLPCGTYVVRPYGMRFSILAGRHY